MKNSFISSFEPSQKYRLNKGYVLFFCILFVLSFWVLEGINKQFEKNKSKNYRVLNTFLQVKDTVQIVFLGDSHFQDGLNLIPYQQMIFNLSFGGTSYMHSYYLIKRYMDDMPELKVVVLPLDLHSFNSSRTERLPELFWNEFIDYRELMEVQGPSALRYKLSTSLLNPLVGKEYFLLNVLERVYPQGVPTEIGFPLHLFMRKRLAQETISEKDFASVQDMIDHEIRKRFYGNEPFDPILLYYFQKILELCREKGIKVVLVRTPSFPYYRQQARAYVTKEDIDMRILNNPDYQNMIHATFDFFEAFNSPEDFRMDGDHLSRQGIARFTRELLSQMRQRIK